MSIHVASTTGPGYPVPASEGDPRFCFGLIHEVGGVLEAYGFPPLSGLDHVELGQALFGFLYRTDGRHTAQTNPTRTMTGTEVEQ